MTDENEFEWEMIETTPDPCPFSTPHVASEECSEILGPVPTLPEPSVSVPSEPLEELPVTGGSLELLVSVALFLIVAGLVSWGFTVLLDRGDRP